MRAAPPWVYLLLIVPFGASGGFLTVALGWRLAQAGVGAETIAGIVAASYLPHTWKFVWAPLVDFTWSRRRWFAASTAVLLAGLLVMGLSGADGSRLGLLGAAVLVANVAATFSGMSVESLMAHDTPDDQKGRAAGWFQAGNLGGSGLGGGFGLWLMERGASPLVAAGVLAVLLLACSAWVVRVPPGERVVPGAAREAMRRLGQDLWSLARSRGGQLALVICFLPIGTGAASNLWSAVAGDWQAGADTIAWVNGTLGGLIAAVGCLVGGWCCDRMARRSAYCAAGGVQVGLLLAMSLAPRSEAMFVLFACAFSFANGLSYAAFSSVALEAIGRGAAATKYNVLASLSNMPIAWVTLADGAAHARWGASGMLQTEAALGLAGIGLFLILAAWRRPVAPACAT